MLHILEVKQYDVVNGPGIRCSIWLAGCNNHCKGCWSSHTWNPNQGKDYKEALATIKSCINNPKIDGISILGGDPFYWIFQDNIEAKEELKSLLKLCHNTNKPIWVWTGYYYEDIPDEYLQYIDTLIDGKYDENQRNLNLKWRGSANQRIINIKHKQ